MMGGGDADKARALLIEEHWHLPDRIARQMRMPSLQDELTSAGREGLMQAAFAFDASQGKPFLALARVRIRGAVIDQMRAWGHLPRRVYAKAKAAGDPVSNLVSWEDILREPTDSLEASPETHAASAEMREQLRIHTTRLPAKERAVVEKVCFEGQTLEQAGQSIGLTKSWTSRLLKRATARLKRRIETAGRTKGETMKTKRPYGAFQNLVKTALETLSKDLGREPTAKEVGAHLGLEAKSHQNVRAVMKRLEGRTNQKSVVKVHPRVASKAAAREAQGFRVSIPTDPAIRKRAETDSALAELIRRRDEYATNVAHLTEVIAFW